MTSSPSLITRSSLPPAGGASVIRCSRRSSRASPGRSAVTKTGEISDDTSGENTGATHTHPLRVPAGPCPPASRRLGDQLEENASDLQRVGPSTAQQDAETKGQGEAARRSPRSFHFERCLGHGLCP